MLTNRQLDVMIKDLLKKPEYQTELEPLSKKQRRNWIKNFLMNSNIKTLDDTMFKFIFNGRDEESCRLIQFVFKSYLDIDIEIDEILSIRNELNRQHALAKTSILDCPFSLEGRNIIIDIEPQSEISNKRIMAKLERYLATMRVFENNIGIKDESAYAFLHLICFYESEYIGDYPENAVVELKKGYHWIRFTEENGIVDNFSKQDMRIVDLIRSTRKFEKEGIDTMNERNMFEFALANAHVMNDEIQKAINMMTKKSLAVKDLMRKRYQYLAYPENRYDSIKQQMNLNTQYWEGHDVGYSKGHDVGYSKGHDVGIDKEREIQRQNMYQMVKENIIKKYDSNPLFLDNLSIDAYHHIINMMLDNASLEDIKNYVESIR